MFDILSSWTYLSRIILWNLYRHQFSCYLEYYCGMYPAVEVLHQNHHHRGTWTPVYIQYKIIEYS